MTFDFLTTRRLAAVLFFAAIMLPAAWAQEDDASDESEATGLPVPTAARPADAALAKDFDDLCEKILAESKKGDSTISTVGIDSETAGMIDRLRSDHPTSAFVLAGLWTTIRLRVEPTSAEADRETKTLLGLLAHVPPQKDVASFVCGLADLLGGFSVEAEKRMIDAGLDMAVRSDAHAIVMARALSLASEWTAAGDFEFASRRLNNLAACAERRGDIHLLPRILVLSAHLFETAGQEKRADADFEAAVADARKNNFPEAAMLAVRMWASSLDRRGQSKTAILKIAEGLERSVDAISFETVRCSVLLAVGISRGDGETAVLAEILEAAANRAKSPLAGIRLLVAAVVARSAIDGSSSGDEVFARLESRILDAAIDPFVRLGLADEAKILLLDVGADRTAFRWLDAIEKALRTAGHADLADRALLIAADAARTLGYSSFARNQLARFPAPKDAVDPAREAMLAMERGMVAADLSLWQEALDELGKARNLFVAVDDRAAVAAQEFGIGTALAVVGRPADAEKSFRAGLSRNASPAWQTAWVEIALAHQAAEKKDFAGADAALARAQWNAVDLADPKIDFLIDLEAIRLRILQGRLIDARQRCAASHIGESRDRGLIALRDLVQAALAAAAGDTATARRWIDLPSGRPIDWDFGAVAETLRFRGGFALENVRAILDLALRAGQSPDGATDASNAELLVAFAEEKRAVERSIATPRAHASVDPREMTGKIADLRRASARAAARDFLNGTTKADRAIHRQIGTEALLERSTAANSSGPTPAAGVDPSARR